MTLKITSPALETVFVEELPPFLEEEKNMFIKRNKISGNKCCPWCLKAHLLKKADELGMEEWAIALIHQKFPGKAGHRGHYLDEEKVFSTI